MVKGMLEKIVLNKMMGNMGMRQMLQLMKTKKGLCLSTNIDTRQICGI